LYCIYLYSIVLYIIVLYCIVLYCIYWYSIVLYSIVLYCIVLLDYLALANWNKCSWVDMLSYSIRIFLANQFPFFLLNAACLVVFTNFIVFGLTQPGVEPTMYRTRGEHANHYYNKNVPVKLVVKYVCCKISSSLTMGQIALSCIIPLVCDSTIACLSSALPLNVSLCHFTIMSLFF
jgi:hypothetical protein